MLDNLNELPCWISRGLEDLFPDNNSEDSEQSFIKRLELSSIEKKPLRVKLGIDPTGTDIHIGHSILFRKLRAFQDAMTNMNIRSCWINTKFYSQRFSFSS